MNDDLKSRLSAALAKPAERIEADKLRTADLHERNEQFVAAVDEVMSAAVRPAAEAFVKTLTASGHKASFQAKPQAAADPITRSPRSTASLTISVEIDSIKGTIEFKGDFAKKKIALSLEPPRVGTPSQHFSPDRLNREFVDEKLVEMIEALTA